MQVHQICSKCISKTYLSLLQIPAKLRVKIQHMQKHIYLYHLKSRYWGKVNAHRYKILFSPKLLNVCVRVKTLIPLCKHSWWCFHPSSCCQGLLSPCHPPKYCHKFHSPSKGQSFFPRISTIYIYKTFRFTFTKIFGFFNSSHHNEKKENKSHSILALNWEPFRNLPFWHLLGV